MTNSYSFYFKKLIYNNDFRRKVACFVRLQIRIFFLKIIKKFLIYMGIFVTDTTPTKSVLDFIKKFKPVGCDKELIRLGPANDGGYLVPNDLENIEACFSPGVGRISDFELDCVKYGMKVFLADKSVDGPIVSHDKFNFLKKFIGGINSDDFITMDDWVLKCSTNPQNDLILQMDIEGYEYEALLMTSEECLKRFRIIVIEFHNFDNLFSKPFFDIVNSIFLKLYKTHSCIHIHPNNYEKTMTIRGIPVPPLLEYTFYRNDRFKSNPNVNLPHYLDKDTCLNKKPVNLPLLWYKNGN